jgi:phospholipid transport system transporter-binding protein
MKLEADRITNVNAAQLLQLGEAAIAAGDSSFDLSSVTRCDSSAVALLLGWRRTAQAHGTRLQLQAVPASLRSLATLYGVEDLIDPAG